MMIDFRHYMVELNSGRVVHVGAEDVHEVIEYCGQKYNDNKIKTIYLEVYNGEDDE